MEKKQKLRKLIQKLTSIDQDVKDVFDPFDKEIETLTTQLKEAARAKTFDKLDEGFKRIESSLPPLMQSIRKIEQGVTTREAELRSQLETKHSELTNYLNETTSKETRDSKERLTPINKQIIKIKEEIRGICGELYRLGKRDNTQFLQGEIKTSVKGVYDVIEGLRGEGKATSESIVSSRVEVQTEINKLTELLEELRKELYSKMSRLGGGAMNRQMLVEGTDYLTKYTDVNLIGGTGVTIVATQDDTNKRVNLTFNSSGGGGGGGSYFVDETPDDGTYGLLSGDVNGVNTTFTVSEAVYITGTLVVWLNGQQISQGADANSFQEDDPDTGTFTSNTAPEVGDTVTAQYMTVQSAGGIESIVAGTNITVDNTDPLNPIVSSTGGDGITQLTGDVTAGPGSGSQASTIANDAVTNSKMANMAQSTIKGRAAAAGTGDPTDLTATQVRTILNVADGATAYTDELAQDAVGGILANTSTVNLSYADATPAITADVNNDSITYAKMQNFGAFKMIANNTYGAANPTEFPFVNSPETLTTGLTLSWSGTPPNTNEAINIRYTQMGIWVKFYMTFLYANPGTSVTALTVTAGLFGTYLPEPAIPAGYSQNSAYLAFAQGRAGTSFAGSSLSVGASGIRRNSGNTATNLMVSFGAINALMIEIEGEYFTDTQL